MNPFAKTIDTSCKTPNPNMTTVSIGVQPTGSVTIIQSVQGSDNSFAYSSSLSALNASIQTSNGTGQLLADDVNTGTYTVIAANMKS